MCISLRLFVKDLTNDTESQHQLYDIYITSCNVGIDLVEKKMCVQKEPHE